MFKHAMSLPRARNQTRLMLPHRRSPSPSPSPRETHMTATLAWWPMRPGSSSPDRILNLEEEPRALGNIGLSPVVIVASQAIIALRDVGVAPHELLLSVSSVSAIVNARPEIMEANTIRWLQSPLRRRKAAARGDFCTPSSFSFSLDYSISIPRIC